MKIARENNFVMRFLQNKQICTRYPKHINYLSDQNFNF